MHVTTWGLIFYVVFFPNQAVERELEILEGKHKGMLTKAQTQSKYGW
jgi:hypothetical protein